MAGLHQVGSVLQKADVTFYSRVLLLSGRGAERLATISTRTRSHF